MKRAIILEKRMGVYLGEEAGIAIFSKLPETGIYEAQSFVSKKAAQDWIDRITHVNPSGNYNFSILEVETKTPEVPYTELLNVGIDRHYLVNMFMALPTISKLIH